MNFKTYYRENFHEKNIKLLEKNFWYLYQTTEFGLIAIPYNIKMDRNIDTDLQIEDDNNYPMEWTDCRYDNMNQAINEKIFSNLLIKQYSSRLASIIISIIYQNNTTPFKTRIPSMKDIMVAQMYVNIHKNKMCILPKGCELLPDHIARSFCTQLYYGYIYKSKKNEKKTIYGSFNKQLGVDEVSSVKYEDDLDGDRVYVGLCLIFVKSGNDDQLER